MSTQGYGALIYKYGYCRQKHSEAQLCGEFDRGESRIIVSADMLDQEGLRDHLFVGLDEDPERVGMTVFSPQLREQSFLARKQEYLRNVESVIGLKRGLLSEVEAADRTATEITSSEGEYMTTLLDLRDAFADAACRCAGLVGTLEGRSLPVPELHWGDGVV